MASGSNQRIVESVIRARNESAAVLGQFKASLVGITAAAAAVAGAMYAVERALSVAIKAASEQERADVKLAVALKSLGQNSQQSRKDLIQFASELQGALGIADEEIQGVMATLIQFGRLSGENLKRATKATLDYAAATGQDAQSAALALSKVIETGSGRLAGMTFKFKDGTTSAERFSQVVDKLEGNLEGTAAALGDTFGGAVDKVALAFSDFEEAVGDIIIKNPAVRQIFTELVVLFQDLTVAIRENGPLISAWISEAVKGAAVALEFAIDLSEMIDKANALSITIKSLKGDWTVLIDAWKAMRGHGEENKATFDRLRAALENIRTTANFVGPRLTDVAEKLGNGKKGVTGATNELTEAQEKAAKAMRDWEVDFRELNSTVSMSRAEVQALGEEIFRQFQESLQPTLIAMEEAVGIFINEGIGGLEEALRETNLQVQSLGDTIDQDIRAAGVNAALAVGDALVDAATGAKVNFKELFVQLLRDLAKSIVRALILRAILAASTGGASEATGGAFAGFAAGEIGVGAKGGTVRGGIPGMDSVMALLKPGEIVLDNRASAAMDAIVARDRRAQGAGAGSFSSSTTIQINNHIEARTAQRMAVELIDEFNTLVERRGFKLVASHVTGP